MNGKSEPSLLIRAAELYRRVIAESAGCADEVEQLLADARRGGTPEEVVAALRTAGWLERARLRHDRARDLLDTAVRIARRRGLTSQLGEALVTRGALNHELGRVAAARRDFEEAAGLIEPALAPELAAQRAALAQNAGRLAEAAALYATILANGSADAAVRVKAANNLGVLEASRGRFAAARARMATAGEIAPAVGPAVVAIVAEGQAWVTVQSGRLTEGLRLFDAAAAAWDAAGLPLGELHAEHADALVALRLLPEAAEQARAAVAALRTSGAELMHAEAGLRWARLALLTGDVDVALASAADVTDVLRRQHRPSWVAQATLVEIEARLRRRTPLAGDDTAARRCASVLVRSGLVPTAVEAYLTAGRVALELGHAATATTSFDRAWALSSGASVLVRLQGRRAAAHSAEVRRRDDELLGHARAGLRDLAQHRAALPSMELRALASGHGAELGRLGLAALARTGTPAQVFRWMERTRAAALTLVHAPPQAVADDLAALRALQTDITAAQHERSVALTQLLARQRELEARIRRTTWTALPSGEAAPEEGSAAGLRRLLGGRWLVEYDVLDQHLVAVVVEPRRTRFVSLASVQDVARELDGLSFALRRLWHRPARASALTARSLDGARRSAELGLAALRAMLVEPLALPDEPVVVVPATPVQRVPWSALHPASLTVAPSAAFWTRTAVRTAPPDGHVTLVAGPELPGAVTEVETLRGDYGTAVTLLPPDSSGNAVAAALRGAKLAHLACHGRARADNPLFSSLLLSDGPMTVQELAQQAPPAHRVVLAACEAGSDQTYDGNETLGFVSTLIASGSAGVVASSIPVPDLSTVALMRDLHDGLRRGQSLGEALHRARSRADRNDPATFVTWCAFTAYGAG